MMTAPDVRKHSRADIARFCLPDAPMTMPVQELAPPSLLRALRPFFAAFSIRR